MSPLASWIVIGLLGVACYQLGIIFERITRPKNGDES